ncbi:hypothetical protein MMC06_005049 [Schaereria dolodes]|nr:hypothetical protein [Schaereria dolodes]
MPNGLTAQRFRPQVPGQMPRDLYAFNYPYCGNSLRYLSRLDHKEMLIFTDGSCLANSQQSARAGCAFVFGPPGDNQSNCFFRLELIGPYGDELPQTNNRAELRAAIAALQFKNWWNEGVDRIVIATDSGYVVAGITTWIHEWKQNGWFASNGYAVKNKDLWWLLHDEVQRFCSHGCQVLFWQIPRDFNAEADQLAKRGAAIRDACEEFGAAVQYYV